MNRDAEGANHEPTGDPDRGGKALLIVVLVAGAIICAGSIGGAGYFAWKAAQNAVDRAREAEERAAELAAERVHQAEAVQRAGEVGRALVAALAEPDPPRDTFAPDGRPLLSWRVHLLPYLGQADLYRQFRRDEPWDSAANLSLLERMPAVYASASPTADVPPGHTYLRAFSHPGAVLEPVPAAEITAQPADVLVVFDAADAVEWTRPDAMRWLPAGPSPGFGGSFIGAPTFLAVTANGRVVWVKRSVPDDHLRQLFDRRANQRAIRPLAEYLD